MFNFYFSNSCGSRCEYLNSSYRCHRTEIECRVLGAMHVIKCVGCFMDNHLSESDTYQPVLYLASHNMKEKFSFSHHRLIITNLPLAIQINLTGSSF